MREIFLGSKKINEDSEPYIIAEIGVNHENSLQKAFELIDLAKEGGADAVKFQTYKAEKISNKNARRSIVIKKKVLKNDTLTNDMLICKRPGTGISPSNIDRIIGRKAIKDLDEDHILDWLDISDQ
jgi:sialic acid synthase SpsE